MGFKGLLVFCCVMYLKMKHSCFVFIGFFQVAFYSRKVRHFWLFNNIQFYMYNTIDIDLTNSFLLLGHSFHFTVYPNCCHYIITLPDSIEHCV